MEEIFFKLYSDLHNTGYKSENLLKRYLFTTKQHVILMFFIASQKGKRCTLEEICYNISPKVISRSTIQNILKEGVNVGFLKKELNETDKRSKFFKLTQDAKKLLENWAIKQSETFKSYKKSA